MTQSSYSSFKENVANTTVYHSDSKLWSSLFTVAKYVQSMIQQVGYCTYLLCVLPVLDPQAMSSTAEGQQRPTHLQ